MMGILAVWNDCAPGAESDYERWYIGEHLPERLGVPGFRKGWRYEAVAADPRYFTNLRSRWADCTLYGNWCTLRLTNP